MFVLENNFSSKRAGKICQLQTSLLPGVIVLMFSISINLRVFGQSDSSMIASNHKLLSARQLLIEGTECLHNNQNLQAKVKLEKACDIAPDLPQAHHQLGIALAKLGENDAAINEFSEAIKLDPSSAASLLNLAAVYQTSGNLQLAKSTYLEFVSRFPQDKDISKIKALVASLDVPAAAFNKTAMQNTDKASGDNVLTNSTSNNSTDLSKGESPRANAIRNETEGDYYAEISRRGIWIWPKDRLPLKVYIDSAKSGNGASQQYISILKNAFKDWAAGSAGLLDFCFIDTADKADIVCTWSKDKSKFKNSSEAANSRVYAKNEMLDKGEIEILTVTADNSGPITDNQARATSLHEIGHIIGLTGHSSNPQDVMYISSLLKDTWTKLSSRDINTLRCLYANVVR